MSTITLNHGDVVEQLKLIADNSVDAIITDPPYNLSFMGKKWDNKGAPKQFQEWCSAWSTECLRVLRSGGYLLSFGGTRTFHRIASGIEDAGFVIKDCLSWNYGSGFPKSHNISKAIDKKAGAKREVTGLGSTACSDFPNKCQGHGDKNGRYNETIHALPTAPSTPKAKQWDGYGTALKPAWEPIILAQKPFKGTIVNNVLAHGVGGMNIDATRIGSFTNTRPSGLTRWNDYRHGASKYSTESKVTIGKGRFPANAIFDEEAGQILDSQSGILKSGGGNKSNRNSKSAFGGGAEYDDIRLADNGGASRFFYCPKTPKKEKTCMGFVDNKHPTVKPIKLMEWLIKLVCPTAEAMGRQPVIIDCFVGSGSTALAANRVGVDCIGIDADSESLKTARLRLMNDWRLEKSSNLKLRGFISKQTIEEEE